MQVYLNGSFVDHNEAKVSVADRGFIFGDGIYEVTRVVNGSLFREKEHLVRMDQGLKSLKIDLDDSVRNAIPEISRELLEKNNLLDGEAAIYLQITRGTAWPRTHTFPNPAVKPSIYLSVSEFSPHTELHKTGVDVITLADVRWTRCNIKTVQLLPNTLARQQAIEHGVNSALMIRDGVITESPNANIFGVKDGALYTYPESNYILSGITRGAVLEIAEKLDIPVHFNPIREEELFELDELFFSGTTTDIQPVTVVNGKNLGTGKPGPIVKSIQDEYRKLLYG
ncbi:aminotransferase class IV [Rhodohalobacter sulfatireducens]|uniref:Aminotransferase class IV n=1 Tax=Rhodohalobacter sulfatireducens TaxID=2911366 RepID=A0ABS9KCD8_9BACT|nr:aminotransferase class IV [Rhodohalobacter sulfatireducens]MCG2588519.1 aminotransferase class IV [Rhodohalobacter sulfatireducens]